MLQLAAAQPAQSHRGARTARRAGAAPARRERPREGHALALAARRLVRVARPCCSPRRARACAARVGCARAAGEPEGDVVLDRKVREQRVVLEDHADPPPLRRHDRPGPPLTAATRQPASGASKPAISRSRVVLPQPEGPSTAINSPRSIARFTPQHARVSVEPTGRPAQPEVAHVRASAPAQAPGGGRRARLPAPRQPDHQSHRGAAPRARSSAPARRPSRTATPRCAARPRSPGCPGQRPQQRAWRASFMTSTNTSSAAGEPPVRIKGTCTRASTLRRRGRGRAPLRRAAAAPAGGWPRPRPRRCQEAHEVGVEKSDHGPGEEQPGAARPSMLARGPPGAARSPQGHRPRSREPVADRSGAAPPRCRERLCAHAVREREQQGHGTSSVSDSRQQQAVPGRRRNSGGSRPARLRPRPSAQLAVRIPPISARSDQ